MSTDNNDLTNIDFDHDWQCYCRSTCKYTDDVIDVLSSNVLYSNRQWSSVTLPHIIDSTPQDNHNITGSYEWWYRKQFDWILSDQQQQENQVYIIFESSNSKHDSNTLNIMGTVWLNEKQIFSNSLLSQRKPIELPHELLHAGKTTEKNKNKNTLIVCCANMSLSLHIRLVVRGTVVWASGQVKIDNKIIRDNDDLNYEKKNNILNYSVSFDGDDRRISVVFSDPRQKFDLSSYPSPTEPLFEPITVETETKDNKEDLEDISVPRLAIVILIVGTRGDVQPFIA